MGKIKDFFKNLISKLRGKEEEHEPAPGDNLIIRTFKNGEKLTQIKESDSAEIKSFCALIQAFAKWNDYNIVYDIPKKSINIYFTVKKAADFENIKNNEKEDKK